jgi:isopenicillin-N N-acyltransferase like protein
MSFYAGLFAETAKMDWPKVQELAMTFEPVMRRKWPAYLEEINGKNVRRFN